jgi:hypothetical protein
MLHLEFEQLALLWLVLNVMLICVLWDNICLILV